jgi:hypothetical protein
MGTLCRVDPTPSCAQVFVQKRGPIHHGDGGAICASFTLSRRCKVGKEIVRLPIRDSEIECSIRSSMTPETLSVGDAINRL